MNKTMFWSGLGMMALQLLVVMVYLLSSADWSWLNSEFIIKSVGFIVLAIFNVVSLIFMLLGATSNG